MLIPNKDKTLRREETILTELHDLYGRYGYVRYKMSKFEEYELYVQNKDFLSASGIITFTDTNGRLMALKPDVTLSIIRNLTKKNGVQKVYYNENVYRISKSSGRFREIMQTGLECVGEIGAYEICETLLLAVRSLEAADRDYHLDLAHMGILSALMKPLALSEKSRSAMITCIRRKNAEGIAQLCEEEKADRAAAEALSEVIGLYGSPAAVLPKLKRICAAVGVEEALAELMAVAGFLGDCGYGDRISLDFSVVNDMNYYNGIVFRGYVAGISEGVLTGGSYDLLMRKMGRACGGIGFAICLDSLSQLDSTLKPFDYNCLLVYGGASPVEVTKAMESLQREGGSVLAARERPEDVRAGRVLVLKNDGTLKEES